MFFIMYGIIHTIIYRFPPTARTANEVSLMDLGFAGPGGLSARLAFLYEDVQNWSRTSGSSLHMVHFTAELFAISTQADFPAGYLGA